MKVFAPQARYGGNVRVLRLAGAVLVEAHDECQTGDRRYLAEGTMALLAAPTASAKDVAHRELIPA
jgi:putative transposase